MIQLSFDFEATVLSVSDVIAAMAVEKASVTVAEPNVREASPVEETSVVMSVPAAIETQPVREGPIVVVELWDGLVSPCRKCDRVGKSKKNCSLDCSALRCFQEKLKNIVTTYRASDPQGSEVEFGYIQPGRGGYSPHPGEVASLPI
jgi:hypothetical protein